MKRHHSGESGLRCLLYWGERDWAVSIWLIFVKQIEKNGFIVYNRGMLYKGVYYEG